MSVFFLNFPSSSVNLTRPQNQLCELYNRADLLLLPSTFDTFGCVVLEAMSCGLPVCAYAVKGPADIIGHGESGFLARTMEDFVGAVALFSAEPDAYETLREQAYLRSKAYCPENIMNQMLIDLGFDVSEGQPRKAEISGPWEHDDLPRAVEPQFFEIAATKGSVYGAEF